MAHEKPPARLSSGTWWQHKARGYTAIVPKNFRLWREDTRSTKIPLLIEGVGILVQHVDTAILRADFRRIRAVAGPKRHPLPLWFDQALQNPGICPLFIDDVHGKSYDFQSRVGDYLCFSGLDETVPFISWPMARMNTVLMHVEGINYRVRLRLNSPLQSWAAQLLDDRF